MQIMMEKGRWRRAEREDIGAGTSSIPIGATNKDQRERPKVGSETELADAHRACWDQS